MNETMLKELNDILASQDEDIDMGFVLPSEGANAALDRIYQEGLIWEILKEYAKDYPALLKGIKAIQTNQPSARIKDL